MYTGILKVLEVGNNLGVWSVIFRYFDQLLMKYVLVHS